MSITKEELFAKVNQAVEDGDEEAWQAAMLELLDGLEGIKARLLEQKQQAESD